MTDKSAMNRPLALIPFALIAAFVAAGALWHLGDLRAHNSVQSVPTGELKDQVTAVFVEPVTLVVNCCVCDAARVFVAGLIDTATGGFTVTVATADLDGSATLVAVTVMFCVIAIEAGAV